MNALLLDHHRALIDASGITPEVAAARGYRSIARAEEAVALGFAVYQARVPALLVPIRGIDGRIVSHQLRPDDPRVDKKGKPLKYETPAGSRMVLDIPPAVRLVLGDPGVPLIVTEGVRKADSAVSHGGRCIALLGVYNFRGKNEKGGKVALPEWESIALNGRDVNIAYDSDVMTNPNVGAALARLTAFLQGRGAHVRHIYLPSTAEGGKQGLDDYLAAGHSMADVHALARDPEPEGAGTTAWEPRIVSLADVRPERVRWLWPGYVPLGKLVLLDGDPRMGKSTLLFDIAARVSTGTPMPDGGPSEIDGPEGVVILSAEDGLADTIRPRLDAAGADVSRIVALDAMESGDKERGVSLADIDAIETTIAAIGAKLVIIDPLMAYMGSDTNSYRDQDVRGVLAPLARLAERHGVAIVVVRHLSKGAQSNVLYRGGGSIGIIGAVRSGLMVGHDPEDPEGPRRILAVSKSNLAALPPALAYHMEGTGNGTAGIVWEGTTHHTAAAITATMQQDDGESRTERDEAADAIRTALADGRRVQKDVLREVRDMTGCSDSTIQRARRRLGVKSEREGFGPGSLVYWRLPDVWDGPVADTYLSHTVHTSQLPEIDKYERYVTSMPEDGSESTAGALPPPSPPTSRAITDRDLPHLFPGHREAATDDD